MAKRNISVPLKNDNGEVVGLICTQCGVGKTLNDFYNHKNAQFGKSEKCKDCTKAYYKDPDVRMTVYLKSARNRCNNKRFKTYFDKGIQCFLTLEDIYYLWDRDKAHLLSKPSLDRMDNNKNYTRENCQFIEHAENSIKDNFIPVVQKDINGVIINTFPSIIEAARHIGRSYDTISAVIRGRQKTAAGFLWERLDGKPNKDYSRFRKTRVPS